MSVTNSSITDNKADNNQKILVDYSSLGTKRPWVKRKEQNQILADAYAKLGQHYEQEYNANKINRLMDCGTYLKFGECSDHQEKKLVEANFCRGRLCPMCQWRRSMKLAYQVNEICHLALLENPKLRFIALTLTVENVQAGKLEDEISELNYAFSKLKNRKEVDKVLEGYFKSLEVTYNSDTNRYHPHFHCILAVNTNYFGSCYIKQARWTELWRQSLKVDYSPIVDVRTIKKQGGQGDKPSKVAEDRSEYRADIASASGEVAKYSTKPDDYLDDDSADMDVVHTLKTALKGRRLVTFGGLLRDIRQEIDAEDVESEDADLTDVGEDEECHCEVCGSELIDVVYQWNVGASQYIRKD